MAFRMATTTKKVMRKLVFGLIYLGLFFAHGLLGAVIYRSIENNFKIIDRRNSSKCLANHNFRSTLFYTNGLSPTLGYKQVYPCTYLGRAFSVLHCLLGVPITLNLIQRIGEICEFILRKIWNSLIRLAVVLKCRSREFNFNRDYPVPFSVGFVVTSFWLGLVAFASYKLEETAEIWDSLYISIRTITKVGIGKFAPNEYYLILLGISFFGLTVFSTASRILKTNMTEWIRLVNEQILEEKIGKNVNLPDDELEAKAVHRLQKVLRKTVGPILSKLLLAGTVRELTKKLVAQYKRHNTGSLAVVPTHTQANQFSPVVFERVSQTFTHVKDVATEIDYAHSDSETQTDATENEDQLVQTDISFVASRNLYAVQRIPKNFLRVSSQ